jgi:hypothetical protein
LLFIITGITHSAILVWIKGFEHVLIFINFDTEGKGPDRKKYEERIKRLNLRRVAFRTMWLASEDYPLLLGKLFNCPKSFTMLHRC